MDPERGKFFNYLLDKSASGRRDRYYKHSCRTAIYIDEKLSISAYIKDIFDPAHPLKEDLPHLISSDQCQEVRLGSMNYLTE